MTTSLTTGVSGWPDMGCRAGRIVAAGVRDDAGAMTDTLMNPQTIPMTATTHEQPFEQHREPTRPRGVRRVLYDSVYAFTSFVIALPALVIVVTDLALGVGLAVLVGGILLLWVAVMVARGFARFERIRLRGLLGKPAPTPAYLCPRPEDSFWRKAFLPLRDAQSWLDVLWCVVGLLTGTVAFALAVAWWAAAAGGLTYWFWQRWIPESSGGTTGLADVLGLGDTRHDEIVLNLVIGAVALLTLPLVMRFAAALHGSLAHVLLSSRAELQQEVRRVEGGRQAARAAEAASLRRLERDIHDGPQQRLVRLTMDLGRARRQLAEDPDRAGETIDAALLQARETVDELRSLSRGIAPPLLVDRGLSAALGELTVRSEVPVEATIDVPDSLPPHVETAVYFVVAEALTNVVKHSGATRASVGVWVEGGGVEVRIEDDGVGGAHPAQGSGRAGHQQRVLAADGRLEVTSPEGGPTVVAAFVPVGGA
jgi:signal transduction histidine kinase